MDCFKIEKDKSLIRFLNALPSGESIDIYIGGVMVFENIKNNEFTSYIYLVKNTHKIDIYISDTDTILIKTSMPIPKNEIFTISLTGNIGQETLIISEDSLEYVPSKEEAIERVVNLAPNLPSVSLLYNDKPSLGNIDYRDQTPYAYIPPGEYEVVMEDSMTGSEITSSKFNYKVERIYTLYIVENKNNYYLIQSVDGNTYACR